MPGFGSGGGAGGGTNAVARFAALAKTIDAATESVKALETAVKGMSSVVSTEAPKMRAELAETGQIALGAAIAFKDAAGEWRQHQLDMLERLRQMVIPFEGSDAGSQYSYDKQIEEAIARVNAGGNATTIIQDLQRMFSATYGVLQRTFFGSQDPGAQEFLLALQRFINSGVLN